MECFLTLLSVCYVQAAYMPMQVAPMQQVMPRELQPPMNPMEQLQMQQGPMPFQAPQPFPRMQQPQQPPSIAAFAPQATLPNLQSPLPQSTSRLRQELAWSEYLSTVLMDTGPQWAVTDLNKSIYKHNANEKFSKFFKNMVDRLAGKAQRWGVRVRRALGLNPRVQDIYLALKSGRLGEAVKLTRPSMAVGGDEGMLRLAVRLIVIDSIHRQSLVRLWSPSFGLTMQQKHAVLDYFEALAAMQCTDDVPPLTSIPFGDAMRLRMLAMLNRDIRSIDDPNASADEVDMARLAYTFNHGDLCASGSLRSYYVSKWFTVPRTQAYARFFARAANVCKGEAAGRGWSDLCQREAGAELPLAMLLANGCPEHVRVEQVGRLERLFWAQVWVGDCLGARSALLAIRDTLHSTLLANPAITARYNYLVNAVTESDSSRCIPSPNSSAFASPLYTGIVKLLEYGHYGDAMFEWRLFHATNCHHRGPLADDLELLIRIAANPRAIYVPCLTNTLLTSDRMVNLEILRKADKYGERRRGRGGRFLTHLMGMVRAEPAIRLRMKAAMIAGRLELAKELAERLPKDQEAAEIRACATLCSSRNSACKAEKRYAKLMARVRSPSSAIKLSSAIAALVCSGQSVESFDPTSIRYDLQLSVQDMLASIEQKLYFAGLLPRWAHRRFIPIGSDSYRVKGTRRFVSQGLLSSMPAMPGFDGSELIPLPMLNDQERMASEDDQMMSPGLFRY